MTTLATISESIFQLEIAVMKDLSSSDEDESQTITKEVVSRQKERYDHLNQEIVTQICILEPLQSEVFMLFSVYKCCS